MMESILELEALAPSCDGQLDLSSLETEHIQIIRARFAGPNFGMLPKLPSDDGYVMAVKLRPLYAYDLFLQERHTYRAPIPAGATCLLRLDDNVQLDLRAPFDILQFHFKHRSLVQSVDGDDAVPISTLRLPQLGTLDPVISQLAALLLPAMEQPQQASPLFISHVTMAISAHLIHTYGNHREAPQATRGGLSRRQERLAKEMLAENLNGALTIGELARECGLSPAHFAAAFKKTTGFSPTAWLAQQRVQKACGMLSNTTLPLTEIGLASGYTDQAHFTRSFAKLIGLPPGAWRRNL